MDIFKRQAFLNVIFDMFSAHLMATNQLKLSD